MSGFARKVERNKIKKLLEKNKVKRVYPLSKYRFKTDKEIQEEQAKQLTEQMIRTAYESSEFRGNK